MRIKIFLLSGAVASAGCGLDLCVPEFKENVRYDLVALGPASDAAKRAARIPMSSLPSCGALDGLAAAGAVEVLANSSLTYEIPVAGSGGSCMVLGGDILDIPGGAISGSAQGNNPFGINVFFGSFLSAKFGDCEGTYSIYLLRSKQSSGSIFAGAATGSEHPPLLLGRQFGAPVIGATSSTCQPCLDVFEARVQKP